MRLRLTEDVVWSKVAVLGVREVRNPGGEDRVRVTKPVNPFCPVTMITFDGAPVE
jgi:hypothetical protein